MGASPPPVTYTPPPPPPLPPAANPQTIASASVQDAGARAAARLRAAAGQGLDNTYSGAGATAGEAPTAGKRLLGQ